ncbi:MAG TPA: hypothetical protein VJJ21_00550 [Candidatus Nanoarchaeia archaeon]|nr:hypothetical protein [Candidatus Nanoarchaeia archaeon]
MLKRKLQKSKTGQFFLSIPNQLVRLKDWDKGDEIKFIIHDKGDIVLKK